MAGTGSGFREQGGMSGSGIGMRRLKGFGIVLGASVLGMVSRGRLGSVGNSQKLANRIPKPET